MTPPVLAFTQGDPAGIGPEILLKLVAEWLATQERSWSPLLVAEEAALVALKGALPEFPWERLFFLDHPPSASELRRQDDAVLVLDPVAGRRQVTPGQPAAADAAGAIAALDAGLALVLGGTAHALVTAPLSKQVVSRYHLQDFRGHTDYLATACGLETYGRDYLMAFLAPDLQVALLTTHLPLRSAVAGITRRAVAEALGCLCTMAGDGRIAVAGLNPHAGENGLLGEEDNRLIRPAVEDARARGINVQGPESADSVFARMRRGEFDWVLALYHDQGLIAVKSVAFGGATNWTLGLPVVRTSVDHGTAYPLAGQGRASVEPLRNVVATTLKLLAGELPRGR